jgi:hypothetical protein
LITIITLFITFKYNMAAVGSDHHLEVINECLGGTLYARVFRVSNKRAVRRDLSNPSLTVELKKLMFNAMTSSMCTRKRPLDSQKINWNLAPSNRVL